MITAGCARVRELLPLYLEHEAGPDEALTTASHLVSCGACALEARRQMKLSAALRKLTAPVPSPDVSSGVMARLRRMKSDAAATSALKWSAISSVIAAFVLRVSIPAPVWQGGLRILARLGELMDLDTLLGPFFEQMARLLPNPASLLVGPALGGLLPSAPGGSGPSAGWIAGIVVGAGALALLGVLLLTGALLAARPIMGPRRRVRPRF
ncbi:MAG TPA: zf-HC2 domain-containing protein [Verrucomicrobiae bacterium]|nr:zf-HC2 domain-containing protein [Verrucomicrobiae bacterium]